MRGGAARLASQPDPAVRGDNIRPVAPTDQPKPRQTGRQIVFTTFGSLGDLHPYIAIALGLQARGHDAVIATSRHYRQKIEARGIGFRAVRPDRPDLDADRDSMRHIMDSRKGSEYVIRELLMPVLQGVLRRHPGGGRRERTCWFPICVTSPPGWWPRRKAFPGRPAFLQPLGFFSAYDPPVLPQIPFLAKLRFLGPAFHRLLFWLAKRSVRSWCEPWHRLRAEIGLPPTSENPLFEGLYSPSLVLAMFSQVVRRQTAGLASANRHHRLSVLGQGRRGRDAARVGSLPRRGPAAPGIHARLVGGGGRWAVLRTQFAAAAARLGRRAVLIVGKDPGNRPRSLPDGVVAFDYAAFLGAFPKGGRDCHPGGIGTTGLGDAFRSSDARHALLPTTSSTTPPGQRGSASLAPYFAAGIRLSRVSSELHQLLDNPEVLEGTRTRSASA